MSQSSSPVHRPDSGDFYAGWLAASDRNEDELSHTPVVARGQDLRWVETVNDHAIAIQTIHTIAGMSRCVAMSDG